MNSQKLIDIGEIIEKNPSLKTLRPFVPAISRFLRVDQVNENYEYVSRYLDASEGKLNFYEAALEANGVSYEVSEEDLAKIPLEGPLFVVANHPYGAIDGIILGALLTRVRPDVKLLVNELLGKMDRFRPYIFGVNVFGGNDSKKQNIRTMKQVFSWLESGGCIGTFPAGEVSHFSFEHLLVRDGDWNPNLHRLIHRTRATVLPVYFSGRNSNLFQMLGILHARFRTLMIGREYTRCLQKNYPVKIGKPILYNQLKKYESPKELMQFMRLSTYILSNRGDAKPDAMRRFPLKMTPKQKAWDSIIEPIDTQLLLQDVEVLKNTDNELVNHGTYTVFYAQPLQIPHVLKEIGRLREETFRLVGEGTGKSVDLDAFDAHYTHLFMWNNESCEIIGAYRIGPTDIILKSHGKEGLYVTSLFKFKDDLIQELNPALELGRSFIRVEYQRKHASLSLIWRGIGEYLVRNPQYNYLFGPVSITQEYSSISKDLMVQFLSKKKTHPELSKFVKAKNPPRSRRFAKLLKYLAPDSLEDISDISAIISEIESDKKGVPILLKHYLKLNGVMLSFNRDPQFNNVIDGLILVDLNQTDEAILKRYMGEAGYQTYASAQQSKDIVV